MNELSITPAAVDVSIPVTIKQIRNLLVNALEGGSNYWATVLGYQYATGLEASDFKMGGKFQESEDYYHPSQLVPTIDGCALKIEIEGSPGGKNEFIPKFPVKDALYLLLTKEKLIRGVHVMAKCQLPHFVDWINGTDDATTGDVYLQCCLFPEHVEKTGEVIFG